jgi:hypothetical protein
LNMGEGWRLACRSQPRQRRGRTIRTPEGATSQAQAITSTPAAMSGAVTAARVRAR